MRLGGLQPAHLFHAPEHPLEGEPQADPELAARCLIATPHIAGYSLEGKLRGTAQIYQAYCAWRGIAERVSLQDVLPETWLAGLQLNPS